MLTKEEKRLIDRLTIAQFSTNATLDEVELEMPVYKEK